MNLKNVYAKIAAIGTTVGAGLAYMVGVGAQSQFATADSTIVTLFNDLETSMLAVLGAAVTLSGLGFLIVWAYRKGRKALHGSV